MVLFLGTVILGGCGGSAKENVQFEPDPFPEPEPMAVVEPEKKVEEKMEVAPEEQPVDKPVRLFTVYFDFDQSTLTAEARAILAENARTLLDHPDINVRIEGHCDERGTVEYNLALGERRALAVRNYLINYGIEPSRITVISYGKERPAVFGSGPEAWAKNRRAEFVNLSQ